MKFIKWFLVIVVVLAVLFFTVGRPYLQEQTKKNSPQKTATYTRNGLDLTVNYSSPFKKGRVIFGGLVPYDKVWRTGANEPTTFTSTTDLTIEGKKLPAGTYSLWTLPKKDSWSVFFNSEVPDWGVTLLSGGTETTRTPDLDVVQVVVPTKIVTPAQESFRIDFEDGRQLYLVFSWDETVVKVPINR